MKQVLQNKYFYYICDMKAETLPNTGKIYTITGFAKKIKKSRATVWRWATMKRYKNYLKMYDAMPIDVDGKDMIQLK
jgi:hypothetical protein